MVIDNLYPGTFENLYWSTEKGVHIITNKYFRIIWPFYETKILRLAEKKLEKMKQFVIWKIEKNPRSFFAQKMKSFLRKVSLGNMNFVEMLHQGTRCWQGTKYISGSCEKWDCWYTSVKSKPFTNIWSA